MRVDPRYFRPADLETLLGDQPRQGASGMGTGDYGAGDVYRDGGGRFEDSPATRPAETARL